MGSPKQVVLIKCEVQRFRDESNDELIEKKAMGEEFAEVYEPASRAGISTTY